MNLRAVVTALPEYLCVCTEWS